MKKWLFNPFVYIAGGKSLLFGAVVMVAAASVEYSTYTHFDGILHITPGIPATFWTSLGEEIINWLTISVVLIVAAIIFSNSKVRVIDIAGTQALARWPGILIVPLGACIPVPNTMDTMAYAKQINAVTIICALLSLTFMVWMVALSYNAFKVSANMKRGKGVAVFVISLLLADFLSRIIFKYI